MTHLRQRMLEELQRRNYSPATIRSYLRCVAEFAQHFHRSPDQLGADDIRQFQLFLIKRRRLAWSTYNVFVSGIKGRCRRGFDNREDQDRSRRNDRGRGGTGIRSGPA
jgi:integrase/recombinase XerD